MAQGQSGLDWAQVAHSGGGKLGVLFNASNPPMQQLPKANQTARRMPVRTVGVKIANTRMA